MFRLIEPPAAVMVPWATTGSLIEPVPLKPMPAGTVSVVPSTWAGSPAVVKPASPVDVLNPAGTIKSPLLPTLTDQSE